MQDVVDVVQSEWDHILATHRPSSWPETYVTIKFRLNSRGEVIEILDVEGNADRFGTAAALAAIHDKAPYQKWTKEMIAVLGNEQTITLTFNYLSERKRPHKSAASTTSAGTSPAEQPRVQASGARHL